MSNIVDTTKAALDLILANKARCAIGVTTVLAVLGVQLGNGEADVLVTLVAFVLFVAEEAARLAVKVRTKPAPAPVVAPPTPPAAA